MDVAASIQAVLDEAVLRLTRSLAKQTGSKNLCLAGGVALNCVANGKVLRDGHFENIWIQPAAGDAGGAVGVGAGGLSPLQGPAAPDQRRRRHGRLLSRPELRASRDRAAPDRGRRKVRRARRSRDDRDDRAGAGRRRRPSAGFRAAWNSARARSARARSSAIRARPRCKRTSTSRSNTARVFARSRRRCCARMYRTGSISIPTAPTCCSSPTSGRKSTAR